MTHKLYSILFLAGNVLLYTVLQFALNLTTVYAEMGSLLLNNLGASSQQYPPDDYENDNRHGYKSAQVIVVDDSEPQQHNFHKAGDVDWVKFYGLADRGLIYVIEVVNPGNKCDVVMELYDTDGTTRLLKKNDFREGEPETLDYIPSKDGIYYVKVFNYNPDIYGPDTEYGLKFYITSYWSPPPLIRILTGIISDSITKAPIRNATVRTDDTSSLSDAKGSYTLIVGTGEFTLTVNACGYYPFSQNISIGPGMETFNVEMRPIGSVNEAGKASYGNAFNGITYSTNVFAAAGDYGALVTSPDGKTWTDKSFSTDNELYGIAYGNNRFVSVGDYGTILYSTDSIPWTKATSNTRNDLYGITYGDGLFIAVGEGGTILSSPDGNTWTDWSLTTNNALYGVTYGNGVFLAVGDDRAIVVLPEHPSIVLQSPLNGTSYGACSLSSPPTFSWWTLKESFKGFEVQFSSDQSFSSSVKVKGTTTQVLLSSAAWKKVLMLPGSSSSGGSVYWRVMGRKADGSTVFSGVRSIGVEAAEAVGNPALSPTSKSSLPILSWENNCGVKFKVWFENDSDFTKPGIKKKALSFNIKNPNDNDGVFTKALTSGQWMSIRKLVSDVMGSTIYWYVESTDGLNRTSKTGNRVLPLRISPSFSSLSKGRSMIH